MELENKKHEQFCIEYIKDMNATRAYMRVYNCNKTNADRHASRLANSEAVANRIRELQKQSLEQAQFTVQDVMNGLVRNYLIASGQMPWKHPDPETGEIIETYMFENNNANKALELIGKQLGMYVTKIDMNTNIEGGVVINNDIPRSKS